MLNIRQFVNGLRIIPVSSLTLDRMGELQVDQSTGKLNYYDGSSISPIVTESSTATLTNKTIDASSNSVANITNASISLTAAIDASKIANGSVSSIEFQYLDGVTSSIQSQFNAITGSAVTSLTGDITGTGPGATATTIAANVVTNAKLAQMGAHTFKGNNTGSTANALDLTQAQLTAELNLFTSSLQGLVPSSGGGTTNFLRADGTFATPPNSGGTVSSIGTIDSQSKSANGLVISGSSLVAQSADGSFPGMVTISAQTFAGAKTFSTSVKTPQLTDNGAGLLIIGSSNQNVTIQSQNAGRIIFNPSEAIDIEQVSTPSNPASGYNSLYFKNDNNLYSLTSTGSEKQIGAGSGGSSGVNFLTLDTSFKPTKSDNSDFEASLGDWVAYADAAGSLPVDMTGGSPTITLSRTTTVGEVLDGAASAKVVKGASNLQGNGISCTANIPLGYRGQIISIQLPFKVISGTLIDGDLIAVAYDITNSQVIVPSNNSITSTGLIKATFAIPSNTTQIRFGFHFASTSATALTFSIDDVMVGPQEVVFGPSMTDWQDYTPVFTNMGTVTNINFRWKQIGDSIRIIGYFTNGTGSGSAASFSLPSGLSTSSILTAYQVMGTFSTDLSNVQANTSILAGPSSTAINFGFSNTTNGDGTPMHGNVYSNGVNFSIEAEIPIQGLSTNVVSQNAGMFQISNILANGTQVTGSDPTLLGQYRAFYRATGASNALTDCTTISTPPSSSNGIFIDGSVAGNSTGTNTVPQAYAIFIGKGKQFSLQWYATTGRTGSVTVDATQFNSSGDAGAYTSYDPTTGLLEVNASLFYAGTESARVLGSSLGTSPGSVNTGYFDVFVSEQVVPVQLAPSNFYISSAVTSNSSNITSGSFTTFSTSPALTFIPTISGTYKVYSDSPYYTQNPNVVVYARIFNTSGGAALISEGRTAVYAQTDQGVSPGYVQSVYTLTAGVTYVFDLQGIADPTGIIAAYVGTTGQWYIYAEKVGG